MRRKTARRATSAVAVIDAGPVEEDDPLLAFPPYLHAAPRGNSITPARQRTFIAELAASGIVSQAARKIGKSLEALYKLRARPGAEGFAAAWEMAIERGLARLEDCAVELAIAGEELPIVSAGKLLGTYRKHNFGHIRFVLQQRRTARWGQEGTHFASLRPGHPVYDRLQAEWLREHNARSARESEEIIRSIDAKLEMIRVRKIAIGQLKQAPDGTVYDPREVDDGEDARRRTDCTLPPNGDGRAGGRR